MIEIIMLELISLVSFLYALILIFFQFTFMNRLAGIFIWTIISALIISISIGKSKGYNLTVLLLFAPLLFYRDFPYIILILITTIIIFIYILSSLQKGKYHGYANMFKKSIILYIVLLYLKIIGTQFKWFLGKESIFLIIYLLSSIVLIRSIRHLDTNIDVRNIKNSNRKYLISIAVVFVIGTFDRFRNSIFVGVSKVFEFIEYVLYILTYPLIRFLTWFYAQMEDIMKAQEEIIENGLPSAAITEPEMVESFTQYVQRNFLILKILSASFLFIAVIFILYKLLSKNGERNYIGAEYTEHREYIKDEKKKKRRLFGDPYPRKPKDQIRYYYRKYLDKLDKEDIEILKTDTSFEINKKARNIFGSDVEKIRNIYIESRYSSRDVDKEVVEEMKGSYKNL